MTQTPTDEQQAIIDHKDGHLLVLAGPGTGKTFVLVERVQKLAAYDDIAEEDILCIKFTDKATEEMSDRLAKLGNTKTKVSTFHAFCKEICTENSVKSGLTADSQLVTEELMKLWAIRNSDSFGLDEKIINFVKDSASGNSAIFYVHPWELDPEQPRVELPRRIGVIHYWNLDAVVGRLQRLLADFRFTTMARLLERRHDLQQTP